MHFASKWFWFAKVSKKIESAENWLKIVDFRWTFKKIEEKKKIQPSPTKLRIFWRKSGHYFVAQSQKIFKIIWMNQLDKKRLVEIVLEWLLVINALPNMEAIWWSSRMSATWHYCRNLWQHFKLFQIWPPIKTFKMKSSQSGNFI